MMATQVTLGEVAELASGFAFKSQQFLDGKEDGVYLLRGENVQQGFIRWGDKAKKWRQEDYEELSRYQLQKGDVILAMDRPIVGGGLKLACIKDQDLPSLLVQRVCRIRGKHGVAGTNYLRYALSAPDFVAHIDRITTGANIPHISGRDISGYPLRLPELSEQDRIAGVLGAYDDLIDSNRRRVTLLEEAARLLYREWFVRLNFPSAQRHLRSQGLPLGWALGSVEDLASLVSRGITPIYDESATGRVVNQKCIRSGRLSLDAARWQSREVKADRQLQVGDVLINSTGAGTLGRVAQVRAPLQDCTVDTHITIVRPSAPKAAAYLGVALLEKEALLSTMGVGSTNQLELPRTAISALPLLLPPEEVQTAFHDAAWPIFDMVESLAQSNEKLKEARDSLLPKLMSGELAV